MKPATPCSHHTLAAGQGCRVERCDHGTVHLVLGALTLRLAPEQLADLAATLDTAVRRVDEAGGRRGARWLC